MKSHVLKRLMSYLGNFKGRFGAAVVTALLGTVLLIAAPRVMGEITTILFAGFKDKLWLYDAAKPESAWITIANYPLGKVTTIVLILIILVLIYLFSWIFNMIANSLLATVSAGMVENLRKDIQAKMHRMKLDYYDTRTNGEVLSVITNDVNAIQLLLGANFFQIITQPIMAIGILIMLFSINGWLALIAVATIPLTFLVSGGTLKASSISFDKQQKLLGDLNGYVEEMYNGQNVITSFNYQKKANERFKEINELLRKSSNKAEATSGAVMPLTTVVNMIGCAVTALVGCIFALQGSMLLGGVQSAMQYVESFQQPFTTFASMAGQISAAMAAGGRIMELLDAEEEVKDPETGKVPSKTDGSVDFKHVKFGYLPNKLLMTDVSVHVEPGQKIAIVGPTGAGKTTLINLLMRFYEINGGEIWVDGVNSKEMTRQELRRHFGMVLQDTWLFEGTIRDNLKYSTEREVSDEEMEAAAKSVCADTFIHTMPGGYDMMLSKGAENISQGQRQLLTIARAIIANPEIMILDEATSNVDAHTEQVIQNAMATLMKGRTSFVIAHRLSTIRDANVILYMENGDIKEVGDHDTLMQQNGKYAALYNSQFG
ncbi:MAG: ABC transporter ATP-binding protein [Lachnospiraceae bacterium]|nr:ABC transporter ATP-binding protein [Lachnospiraceae bacterium]